MAHTKGPWMISEPWSGFSEIVGPNGELIFGLAAGAADEKRDDDECEANARLIAAAPDLLAALKDMLAGWHYIREHHGDLYGVGWDRCETEAIAVIAKAETP